MKTKEEKPLIELWFGTLGQAASLTRNGVDGEIVELTEKQSVKISNYVEKEIKKNKEGDYLALWRSSWSAFIRREKFPVWIERMLYPKGWKAAK